MHAISVGKPLVAGVTRWPQGSEYNWYHNGHELRLFFERPTQRETEGVRKGECEFALVKKDDVLFFLYRFEGVPWSDCPYSYWLVPEDMRATMPPTEATDQTRALLAVILTDATTGIVRAIRTLTFSPEFTRAIHNAIRVQASTPFAGRQAHDAQIASAYQRWAKTDDMLKDAVARTKGGE